MLLAGLAAAMVFATWALNGSTALADEPAPAAQKLDSGDNAWMLTSSALVLMMTGPGLAMFYCGLVRKKNVLSVMMQCAFLMCLMTVIWALYGYTLGLRRRRGMDRRQPITSSCRVPTPVWNDTARRSSRLPPIRRRRSP